MPDFKLNITGCLEKYGDISGAVKWLLRADREISDVEFIQLVDDTIGERYRNESGFAEILHLRDLKWMLLFGMEHIEALFEAYRFKEAREFYLRNEEHLEEVKYRELEQEYRARKDREIAVNALKEIEMLLESYRFEEADKNFYKNRQYLDENEYKGLLNKFSMKQRFEKLTNEIMNKFTMEEQEAELLAKIIFKDFTSYDELTWQDIRSFVVENMRSKAFPRSVYSLLLQDIAEKIRKQGKSTDRDILSDLIGTLLQVENIDTYECENLWTVFDVYPDIFKKVLSDFNILPSGLEKTFPFGNIIKFAEFYLPSEELCLMYLKRHEFSKEDRFISHLLSVFQKRRYFNCVIILALLKAKNDNRKIQLKDIIDDLLKLVISRVFDYKMESKSKIPNLIFPECISQFKNSSFQLSDQKMIFCEGNRYRRKENGEPYVFCRNRQCKERTELLDPNSRTQNDNYFFDFLEKEFRIFKNEISSNTDFIHAMGALNRWNEIAERLVCGYRNTVGCGSALIYSKTPQVKPGPAAYATTYWRCSKSSCQHVENTIKLSHCKGCHKIIDSRFDKISCKRVDGKEFFICRDCGYCCDEHQVSGICPVCAENNGWKRLDEYGKRYSCLACEHEIAVPSRLRNCFNSEAGSKRS